MIFDDEAVEIVGAVGDGLMVFDGDGAGVEETAAVVEL